MHFILRLFLCLSVSMLLSSCQLINTALRLAPLAMLLVDEGGQGAAAAEKRGREVEMRGVHGLRPLEKAPSRAVVVMGR